MQEMTRSLVLPNIKLARLTVVVSTFHGLQHFKSYSAFAEVAVFALLHIRYEPSREIPLACRK